MITSKSVLVCLLAMMILVSSGLGRSIGIDEPGLSYLKAKQHAEMLNMNYVLYFKAEWSKPCRWMDELTLKDSSVVASMDNHFIFVELDIDGFEGYALKKYFEVFTLPTTLVFNSDHQLINRRDGTMSPEKFLEIIDERSDPIRTSEFAVPVVNNPPTKENSHDDYENLTEDPQDLTEPEISEDIILPITYYGVQLGIFSSISNARHVVERAEHLTTASTEIITLLRGEQQLYRVIVGKYKDRSQAEQLEKSLSGYGLTGFVRAVVDSSKS